MIIGYPIFLIIVYRYVDVKTIMSDRFKDRVGVFYEEIRFRHMNEDLEMADTKSRLLWPIAETIRKLLLAFMLVFAIDYPYA